MKRFLKVLVALVLALVIIGGVTFLIDASRVKSEKTPIFVCKGQELKDGGTTEYIGLGYKVIDFNLIDGYHGCVIGPWTMNFDKEYQKYASRRLENLEEETTNPVTEDFPEGNEEINEMTEEQTAEEIPTAIENNPENELVEEEAADIIVSEMEPPVEQTEEAEAENPEEVAVENPEENEVETTEPEEPVAENEISNPTIIATVMGVNGNEIVARVESYDGTESQVDIISFDNPDESQTYTKDQKIRIEFDGILSNDYPAKISVNHVEVME